MKLQVIVILACILAVSADEEYEKMVYHLSRAFDLSTDKIRDCMNKTKVTIEDLEAFPRSFEQLGENPETRENERRGICTLVCFAQKRGLMIGSKLQMTQIHDEIERKVPHDDVEAIFHAAVDSCADAVKNMSDECKVGLQYIKCVGSKVQTALGQVHHP